MKLLNVDASPGFLGAASSVVTVDAHILSIMPPALVRAGYHELRVLVVFIPTSAFSILKFIVEAAWKRGLAVVGVSIFTTGGLEFNKRLTFHTIKDV